MNPQNFRINVLAGSILAMLLCVAFFDVVFLNKTFHVTTANAQALPTGVYGQEFNRPAFIPVNGTDSPVQEEPVYQFIRTQIQRGIIPLWNPHQATGYPLIAMMEVGMFFPLNFILYFFPSILAWDAMILFRFWLGGLLVYAFMRNLRAAPLPSLVGAVTFMLSGPMVLLQYWTANVDILLPLLLLTGDRLLRKPTRQNILPLSASIALTFFAGHPEHVFLVNAYAVAFFLFRMIFRDKFMSLRKIIPLLLLSYVLGLAAAAIVLLPFLDHLKFEFWHGHPAGTGLLMEEQPERALSLALPHFFQKENLTYQWQFSGWWGGYLGTLPLAFAFCGIFRRHKRGSNYFFALAAFLLLAKSYGLPFVNWLGYLPGFAQVRYAIHTPPLVAFSIAVLAGWGSREIIRARHNFHRGIFFAFILAVIILYHFLERRDTFPLALGLRASLIAGVLLTIWLIFIWLTDHHVLRRRAAGILMIILVFGELFFYIHRERPRRFDPFAPVPYMQFLQTTPEPERSYGYYWAFYPGTASGFGVDDLGYFFGLVPKRFVAFTNAMLINDHFKNDLRPPALRAVPIVGKDKALDLLNVRFIIAPSDNWNIRYQPEFHEYLKNWAPVYDNEVNILPRPSALPRAFMVHRARFLPDEEAVLKILPKMANDLDKIVVIQHPSVPRIEALLSQTPETDNSTVSFLEYTPNRVSIEANVENAGFLVFSDAWHPGWHVTINDRPGEIYLADGLIRAVFLTAGQHHLVFTFQPLSYRIGKTISLAAFFALLALWLWPNPQIVKRIKGSKD